MPIDFSKNWKRERQFPPSQAIRGSFRTKVVNKNTELIMARMKATGAWAVQSIRTRR